MNKPLRITLAVFIALFVIVAGIATVVLFSSGFALLDPTGWNTAIDGSVFYKDESGTAQRFYADGYCTLLPAGALGNTWHGVTPEERTLMGNAQADVSVTSDGVAIAVTVTSDPVNTKTTVSEILLPSYERMDETYVIKAY